VGTTISIPGSGNVNYTVFGNGTVIAGGGNDRIEITGHGKIIVGSGHDTLILGKGGTISEQGAGGVDTIHLGATGNYTVFEQGHATVSGAFGSVKIDGGELKVVQGHGHAFGQGFGGFGHSGATEDIAVSGQMTLHGSASPTELIGGSGSTHMIGGTGNDTFIGGSGHDTMRGGSGHNLFAFLTQEKGGDHLIRNFVTGQDHLFVEGHSLDYLEKKNDISTHGGNTYISIDGGKTTIELQGVTTLKASDFFGNKH
jgi:Ca2+-binding RTX toxin-like protein